MPGTQACAPKAQGGTQGPTATKAKQQPPRQTKITRHQGARAPQLGTRPSGLKHEQTNPARECTGAPTRDSASWPEQKSNPAQSGRAPQHGTRPNWPDEKINPTAECRAPQLGTRPTGLQKRNPEGVRAPQHGTRPCGLTQKTKTRPKMPGAPNRDSAEA